MDQSNGCDLGELGGGQRPCVVVAIITSRPAPATYIFNWVGRSRTVRTVMDGGHAKWPSATR